jgi:hypothetical protein
VLAAGPVTDREPTGVPDPPKLLKDLFGADTASMPVRTWLAHI